MDKEAVPGKNITTTIDAQLQQYGQELMAGKVGSVVALEPSTGEILALVSSPGIDVEQLSDIGKHYNEIVKNPYKPMYNRAVQASYPPGSVFKLVNALIGMQEGVLRPEMRYPCSHGYHYGAGHKLGCHGHRSPIDMTESIMMSCNAYYCYVLKNIVDNRKYDSPADGLDHWNEYVKSFGFGRKLGSDFPAELAGSIPSSRTYNRSYGRGRWNSTTVISLSIGQGEILATPMHLANLCATIANRGHYFIPHIVKASEGVEIDPRFYERQYTLVDTTHFPKVIQGMWLAVNAPAGAGGTARVECPRRGRRHGQGGPRGLAGYLRKNRHGAEPARCRQLRVHLFCAQGQPEDCLGGLCGKWRLWGGLRRAHRLAHGREIPQGQNIPAGAGKENDGNQPDGPRKT